MYSQTAKTQKLKKMIYEKYDKKLEPYKKILISRGIKKFNEQNWWSWGRCINFRENEPRIYVNCRTRNKNPFFLNNCKKWDGSILALFPKIKMNLPSVVEKLNSLDWQKMGFTTGGRYIFSQKALTEALIDENRFR